MGDVIPLRQYHPAYASAPAGPAAVRRPVRAAEGAGPRTVADRLGLAGLRITRRGRVVLMLLAMLLVAPMATWGATAVASAPGQPIEVRVHSVQPGETLWGYAQEVARPGEDVRDAVARLQDLNEMSTASVRVGELLLLPEE
ncbi:LysM peptidoglycan-binding domain-containing protein [Promicromonospora thailandica]|uniref:LysM domain-containing protein n=1 Tax=Promicromonospora thailandica TaxID=765201 RepID=A0A9X2G1F7_9MICO|nr:LysM peptidoglycan-binding domain-containing protein [Promicromonospora thailandica]MCP2263918.1 hypothetical protein [Promicromonospora thailandica]